MGIPIHPLWLIVLLAIVLIIFGPGKLPELGGAVGRGIREFRKASSDITSEVKSSIDAKDTPVATTPSTTNTTSAAEPKAESEKPS